MVLPSIQPSSRRRATKAVVHGLKADSSAPRKPIVGSLPRGCARTERGQIVAAPATALMKSRRRIASPQGSEQGIVAGQTGRLEVVKTALMSALGHKQTSH